MKGFANVVDCNLMDDIGDHFLTGFHYVNLIIFEKFYNIRMCVYVCVILSYS